MMKPPIPTLVPVSTSTRVERLRALFGGVGVGAGARRLRLGVTGWRYGRAGGRRTVGVGVGVGVGKMKPLSKARKLGFPNVAKVSAYAVLRKLQDITSASVGDKDITLVAAADQGRKKCEAIRILQNRIRRELLEGSVGEDHLNNVLVRRNENRLFKGPTRQICNDCHGSGIAAQIHRSPDLGTVRGEGRNEGPMRDEKIPIDESTAMPTGAVTVMNGVLVPSGVTLVIASAPFSATRRAVPSKARPMGFEKPDARTVMVPSGVNFRRSPNVLSQT